MTYSNKVLDHYENPRNVGSFDKDDDSVGTGMVGAPACGDVMKLQIKVNADGMIEDARFKTYVRRSRPALWSLNGSRANRLTKPCKSRIRRLRKNWPCHP